MVNMLKNLVAKKKQRYVVCCIIILTMICQFINIKVVRYLYIVASIIIIMQTELRMMF